MKRNTRKLFALVLALAMVLVSLPAVALAEEIDLGGEIVIDEGTVIDVDTQGEEGELEIEMDEGEGLPDGAIDPEGGEDLDLGLDLDGEGLETLEGEELAPVTEEAMNDGETQDGKSEETAFVAQDWPTLVGWFKEIPHKRAACLAVPFPPCTSCKFLDLPPASLRNLQARLTENSLASQPPLLCGISLTMGRKRGPMEKTRISPPITSWTQALFTVGLHLTSGCPIVDMSCWI